MPDTALASWPACLDDVDELTARLRSARVPVGMGDELRLRLLLERLQARGTPIANTEDATHWLSPILCRNADQKKALLVTLNQLESEQASRGRRSTVLFRPAAGVTAQTEQEAAIEEKVRRDRREVHTAWTIAAVVAVGLSIWFFAFFSATKPPDVKSVDPAACTTPPCPKPAPTPIPPTTPQTERAAYWWSFELGLLPIVTALTFIMLRRRRRAFLMRGLVPRETPQDSRMLPVSIDVLFRPDRMRTPAADWRRDRWEESNRFDVKRSIDRTVRAGGEFKIVNARRRIIPEYILLVDRTGTNDMMAVVADHLAARLTAEQVNLVRFDYYGDPRRVVSADPAEVRQRPQKLDDLLFAKRDTHQLVILADPSSAFDPMTRKPRAWLEGLSAWPNPIWMSPLPSAQQGAAERELQRLGFEIAECSCDGVAAVGRLLRRESHTALRPVPLHDESALDALLADPYRWTGDRPPADDDIAELLDELGRSLQPEAMALLAAVAVFPMTDPRLTLYAAERLGAAQGWTDSLEVLVAQISRLPWLRKGYVPEWLRVALVEWLERWENRALGGTIRAMWTQLLERSGKEVEGAPGSEDTERETLSIDFVRVAANSQVVAEQRLEKAKTQDPTAFEERILLAFLTDTPVRQVAFEAPVDWRDLIPSRWSKPEAIAMGLAIAAAAAMVVWSPLLERLIPKTEDISILIGASALASAVVAPLIVLGSFLRSVGGRLRRIFYSSWTAVICTLALYPSVLYLAVAGATNNFAFDANESVILIPTAMAYVLLWLNFNSTIGVRDLTVAMAFVRRPLVGEAVATFVIFTLAFAIVRLMYGSGTFGSTTIEVAFVSRPFWIHMLLAALVAAGLFGSLARCVDTSLPKAVVVASAIGHFVAAMLAVFVLQAVLQALLPLAFDNLHYGVGLSICLAAALSAPAAAASWRDSVRPMLRFAYVFIGIATGFELVKAGAFELMLQFLPKLSVTSSALWFLPALFPAYLIALRLSGRQGEAPKPWRGLAAYLGAMGVAAVLWAALGPADWVLDNAYLVPVLALGLEAGAFVLAARLSGVSWMSNFSASTTVRQPMLPSLTSFLALAWPFLATASAFYAVVVVSLLYTAPLSPPPPTIPSPSGPRSYAVFFDYESATVSQTAEGTISQASSYALQSPNSRVAVTAHVDGSENAQDGVKKISEARLAAVRDLLIKYGVNATSITTQDLGFSRPLVQTAAGVREPQNRRVEIVISTPTSATPNQSRPSAPIQSPPNMPNQAPLDVPNRAAPSKAPSKK